MGKIKRGILGGVSGKVANVVGGSWKGIEYLRALPTSVANPRTPAQVNQRDKFTNATKLASQLVTPIITPFWNQYASEQSGYNLFISRNIAAFNNSGLSSPGDFNLTIGPITPAPISSASWNSSTQEVTINFTNNAGTGNAQGTDQAIAAVYSLNTQEVKTNVSTVQRSAGSITVDGSHVSSGTEFVAMLSFRNQDDESGESNNILQVA